MLSSFSSNVILAKARSMYGRHLTPENYRDLLNCQSVSEIAGYLKNHTAYRSVLSGVVESDVHRGQLEQKLRQKLFDDSAALCRYEITVGEHFAEYIIARGEIEQILHSARLLNAGRPEEYLFAMPLYLNRRTRIDLPALSRVRSFDDLLAALAHTAYRKLLLPFRPVPGIPLNYNGMENALYAHLYAGAFAVIKRYTRGETAKQLREIFTSYIDLLNYVRIARLRFSYMAGPDFTRSNLLPLGSLRPRVLNEMLEADTQEELDAVMGRTSVGKHFLKVEHSYLDQIPMRVKHRTCRRDIRFSTHPSVVLLSYVFLTEAEIIDIITILEGVRYELPVDEIKKLLTVTA